MEPIEPNVVDPFPCEPEPVNADIQMGAQIPSNTQKSSPQQVFLDRMSRLVITPKQLKYLRGAMSLGKCKELIPGTICHFKVKLEKTAHITLIE